MKKKTKLFSFQVLASLLLMCYDTLLSQPLQSQEIKGLVQSFKADERGPYQAIRWFCPDGSILPPDQRCQQPGGIQHALHKNIVQQIAKENHIFFGQILAGTLYEDFWDESSQNSRLKQYQVEKYLFTIDNGWIFRKARYYRGAIQAEDEENWGYDFLTWLVTQKELIDTKFLLIRQVFKDIPHMANENRWNKIRSLSKTIGDSLPAFTNLRVKIHGQPEKADIKSVNEFLEKNQTKITTDQKKQIIDLIKEMELAYQESSLQSMKKYISLLPRDSETKRLLNDILQFDLDAKQSSEDIQKILQKKSEEIANLLWQIRLEIQLTKLPIQRLTLIDLSIELETILFKLIQYWKPTTTSELLNKNSILALASSGCGYIEQWEWEATRSIFDLNSLENDVSIHSFMKIADYSIRLVEWSAISLRTLYNPVISRFGEFEPLANGFIDEQVRSSVLLPFGETAGKLSDLNAGHTKSSNKVLNIKSQNQVRGLNPGFAIGQLEVIQDSPDEIKFDAKKIYVLSHPPSDMKPVAGILTVTEGNLVSHVQLLARNLGIPNSVITMQNFDELLPFSGQHVFYAVSPRGSVIIKPTSQLNSSEKSLVEVKERSEDRVKVPVEKLNLNHMQLTSLRNLRSKDSGITCGPKAANLGQLKNLFPDNVVDGFIIPFGIFRQHLNQQMPGEKISYWQFLQETFFEAENARKNEVSPELIEKTVLTKLSKLREAIQDIQFFDEFKEQLEQRFLEIFNLEIGQIPVFVRSDTNMEDLKDFTGAGLNLTVFNVRESDKIFQGIRDVWASPYSVRSYSWRQKYLLNPENVYPSILIIPSVDVDKSGVLITTGVTTRNPEDITVAFSRGAGGAVEGQIAETYLLQQKNVDLLLTPSRETLFTTLPEKGGVLKNSTTFSIPILCLEDRQKLRTFSDLIKKTLTGQPGIDAKGPLDVELGLKDGKVWLFQVRPYVENKKARSSEYLLSMDPKIPEDKRISLDDIIE